MDTVYITGHRNPDTDSIVSAMAYAALKNALGQREYRAARLGQVSDETQGVLDRFGFQPPMLINNVRNQVRDLDYDTPPTLDASATISRAWQTMQEDKISTMPVTNEDGTLYGMLSAGDVANYDMTFVQDPQVRNLPVYNLLSVLEGQLLNEGPELWEAGHWAVKPNGVILFFAQCPFDKVLGVSNLAMLLYEWVWYKERGTGFLNANRAPLKKSENILVLSHTSPQCKPRVTGG